MADVIAIVVADVIATEADVIACNKFCLADVIANLYVADVIDTEADVIAYEIGVWLMLLPN